MSTRYDLFGYTVLKNTIHLISKNKKSQSTFLFTPFLPLFLPSLSSPFLIRNISELLNNMFHSQVIFLINGKDLKSDDES